MKITTQQIKQIISEELNSILSEAAVGPEDLPEDIRILIDGISEDEIQISYVDSDGSSAGLGSMTVDTVVPLASDFPCLKARWWLMWKQRKDTVLSSMMLLWRLQQ